MEAPLAFVQSEKKQEEDPPSSKRLERRGSSSVPAREENVNNQPREIPPTEEEEQKQREKSKELFDKLIGGKGFDAETSYILCKDAIPENIIPILKLFSTSSPSLQIQILHNLICIVCKSTRNLHLFQNYNTLGVLVEMLPTIQDDKVFEKTLLLIEILGKFSITIRQINAFLALLSDIKSSEDRKVRKRKLFDNLLSQPIP